MSSSPPRLPELWIVAGPNGAGKTTVVQRAPISNPLPGVSFLNSDDWTRQELIRLGYVGFVDAPLEVQAEVFVNCSNRVYEALERAIANNEPVGVETVLSTVRYRSLVESVMNRNGFVGLIYIAVSSPALSLQRVSMRVGKGGHDIPEDKIFQRWYRSLEQLAWFAKNVTAFWVFDNSDSDIAVAPALIAHGQCGVVQFRSPTAFPELHAALDRLS